MNPETSRFCYNNIWLEVKISQFNYVRSVFLALGGYLKHVKGLTRALQGTVFNESVIKLLTSAFRLRMPSKQEILN